MHHLLSKPCQFKMMHRTFNRLLKANNAIKSISRRRSMISISKGRTSSVIHNRIGTNRTLVPCNNNHAGSRAINRRSRECIYRCPNASYYRYRSTTTANTPSDAAAMVSSPFSPPTAHQLTMHALRSAVPMIGFGFMDNTIMIHAGHYVDCTLGVTFGLSTLAAAGIGQIFSGIGGVVFGDALDAAFRKISGSARILSKVQRHMRASRVAGLTGGIVGVTIGCALGLVNLLFVDEHKASLLKLQALEDGQEFEFEVEVDNEVHPGFTTVMVRGPDVDGVLASITASIASIGCSVVELHAARRVRKKDILDENAGGTGSSPPSSNATTASEDSNNTIASLFQPHTKMEDTFLIRDRSTHQAIENEDLEDVARTVLAAAKDPLNSHSLKAQVDELQLENDALADRVSMLESMLEDRQIKVVPSVVKSTD